MKKNDLSRGLALVAGCCLALPAAAQDLVISNARILDGTGNALERGTVVVRDGRIAAVGANASGAPANAVRIDAGGRTVMPGFIDAHRHIIQGDPARWLAEQSAANMREFLAAGFTTVLSAIDAPEQILELRRRTESGETAGPAHRLGSVRAAVARRARRRRRRPRTHGSGARAESSRARRHPAFRPQTRWPPCARPRHAATTRSRR